MLNEIIRFKALTHFDFYTTESSPRMRGSYKSCNGIRPKREYLATHNLCI